MNYAKWNERYSALCHRYGTNVEIRTAPTPSAAPFTINNQGDTPIITLDPTQFSECSYESTLAYAVRRLLLPRLVLQTERLTLRRFQPQDATDCFAFLSDPEGCYFDCCKPFSERNAAYNEQMELFLNREGQYAVVLRESGTVIGTVRVFEDTTRAVEALELGYTISPAYQRHGYATEALAALLTLLQSELRVELILAGVLVENKSSIRLLEKLGFQKEGLRRKCIWHEGLNRPMDLIYYYKER